MCYTAPVQYEYHSNSVFILLKVFGIIFSVLLFKKIRWLMHLNQITTPSIVEMQHEMNILKSLLIQYSRMFIQTFPASCFYRQKFMDINIFI